MHASQLATDESWLPKSTSGRLAMDETYLGPFLAISGLMNDSKELWEHYMENVSRDVDFDSLSNTIQQRLSICRVSWEWKRSYVIWGTLL